jgi:ABC-type bacteriocin/lantibiotic exporter with double-glycine peptidase domain
LDRKNERLIQSTLDKISNERTTMTIAHRAKTIMNADIIYVLNKGKIEEKGKFNELKRFKGHTYEDEEKEYMKTPATTVKVFEKSGFIDLTKDKLA